MEGGVLCVPDWDWHSIIKETIGRFYPLWYPIHFPTLKRGGWLRGLGWFGCWFVDWWLGWLRDGVVWWFGCWSVICRLVDVAVCFSFGWWIHRMRVLHLSFHMVRNLLGTVWVNSLFGDLSMTKVPFLVGMGWCSCFLVLYLQDAGSGSYFVS